jgi:hypothetical protein
MSPRAIVARRVPLLLLLCALFCACSPGTDPGPCTLPECFDVAATMTLQRVVDRFPDSTATTTFALAAFRPVASSSADETDVYAGEVRVDGTRLTPVIAENATRYESRDEPIALRGAPQREVWTVPGSIRVPPIVDSVAVSLDSIITAPTPGQRLVARDGIIVRWNPAPVGSPGVPLDDAAVSDSIVVVSIIDPDVTGVPVTRIAKRSAGEVRFDGAELVARNVAGDVVVGVTHAIRRHGLIAPAYHYEMLVSLVENVAITIAP